MKTPSRSDLDALRPRTVRITDRDWNVIASIAESYLREPGELLRLLSTPSPQPVTEGNHAPYKLSLVHPDQPSGLVLRSYTCTRPKPMAGVGDDACPRCAIRALADQSRCNLALGIGDLRTFLDGLHTPAERKAAVWFTSNVTMLVRKPR